MSALLDIFAEALAPERPVPDLASFGIERLSPSSIEGFWKCAEQWRRERIAKEPRFSTADLLFGSAFHRAAEHNYRQKIDSHEDIPLLEMRDLTGDSWNEVLEETKGTEEIRWYDSEPGEVQAGVIDAMIGSDSSPGYHTVLAPTVQPIAVERWVEVSTPLGLPMVAKIDIETDANAIRDLKTGKKAKTQHDIDSNIQATANLWMRAQEGDPADEFGWHVVVKLKTKQRQDELVTTRTTGEFSAFERLLVVTANTIEDYMTRYGPDGPWPGTSPMSWWCAPTQCSFWLGCSWRGGAK